MVCVIDKYALGTLLTCNFTLFIMSCKANEVVCALHALQFSCLPTSWHVLFVPEKEYIVYLLKTSVVLLGALCFSSLVPVHLFVVVSFIDCAMLKKRWYVMKLKPVK